MRMQREVDLSAAVAAVWAREWPEGSAVVLINDHGEPERTTIKGTCRVVAGVAMVQVVGRAGWYATDRVVPVDPTRSEGERVCSELGLRRSRRRYSVEVAS